MAGNGDYHTASTTIQSTPPQGSQRLIAKNLIVIAAAADDDEEEDNDESANDAPYTFHGYPCTIDCSGHEAGYRWAEEHGIDDPEDCGGNSESFIEGCRAYAEEQLK